MFAGVSRVQWAIPTPVRDNREMMQPTIVELVEMVSDLQQRLGELAEENTRLKVRVAELVAQQKTNSRNSSKPPSTDGLAKPAPKSLRSSSGRRPGGQAGHQGSILNRVTNPDEVVRHEPVACGGCGAGLSDAQPEVGVQRRQVFDLGPVTVRVTEHQR